MQREKSRLHREYFRNGNSHRDGADVSFQDIKKLFNFRTITIGRWVSAQEQQIAANLFFDALYDLADILHVSEQVISLNGSLSLAFGSGGEKHVSAHYHPGRRQLALAKNAGGGALAHEWFHAFDHYIAGKVFAASQAKDFASALWLAEATLLSHPLNLKLDHCFKAIFLDETYTPNEFVNRSIQADKAMGMYYYSQPQELAARAFEACVQDNVIKNAFLVQGTKQSAEARLGIYPHDILRNRIQNAFFDYFAHLGLGVSQSKQMQKADSVVAGQ
ncbi:hypothetical protein OPS25_14150 [Alteromonas ponticola]|uniref:Large polyvalent protein-associated domain-containing protein n=1 Tax=Alteromonas aquimaris TaxID=2998417 RepID=A0ABT3PA44_9ALTE|nr:CLCA_X family protein [Alteromonas aquimaris]MCW8109648.1 hypothetical protein [Alteromonas aquimaris]